MLTYYFNVCASRENGISKIYDVLVQFKMRKECERASKSSDSNRARDPISFLANLNRVAKTN
jgi:hypothetical protein